MTGQANSLSVESIVGNSPNASGSTSGSFGLTYPFLSGASPNDSFSSGFCSKSDSKHVSAKKFWSRLLYDETLEASEFKVGFIETFTADQRRSGRGAWSERQHHQAVELEFEELRNRFSRSELPFHRVSYFKRDDVVVWEAPRNQSLEVPKGSVFESDLQTSGDNLKDATEAVSPRAGEVAELPAECWSAIVQRLGARELSMLSRCSRFHNGLCAERSVWAHCYSRLFGKPPGDDMGALALKRLCRRSELKAARWLEAESSQRAFDFPGTVCLKVDESKVISSDGSSVRLWSHDSGRRIGKLPGQPTASITCLGCDDDLIAAGCAQGAVKLWGMDDLKFMRTLRGHEGPVADVGVLHGMPLSASADGTIRFWDAGQGVAVATLDAGEEVHALALDGHHGRLTSAGRSLDIWDIEIAQRVVRLAEAAGADSDDELLFGMADWPPAQPFTAVSQCGATVAAGGPGHLSLWDVRTASLWHSLELMDRGPVLGLYIDDWKLMMATEASTAVSLFDIRSLSSQESIGKKWPAPVKLFNAGSSVKCFGVGNDAVIIGASHAVSAWHVGGRCHGGCADSKSPEARQPKEKKKPTKVPKRRSRYPKRTTK